MFNYSVFLVINLYDYMIFIILMDHKYNITSLFTFMYCLMIKIIIIIFNILF